MTGYRRLRWLVGILVVSNLMLGVFCVYLLRQVDEDYSHLIAQSLPLINQARQIGKDAGGLYRAVVAGLVTQSPEKCERARIAAEDFLAQGEKTREAVLKSDVLQSEPAMLTELRISGNAYDKAILTILPRVTPQNTADAERDHLEALQVMYERYTAANSRVLNFVEARTQLISGGYTAANHHRSLILLGIAGWPVLVLGAVLATTLAIVLLMLFIFRGAEAGDGP